MIPMTGVILDYLARLSAGSMMLWCYFLWYLIVLVRYFDSSLALWLTSAGLSVIVGCALLVSTTAAGGHPVKLARWQVIRLFLTPFCVSSFAALVRGRDFILVFPRRMNEVLAGIAAWSAFCLLVFIVKYTRRTAN